MKTPGWIPRLAPVVAGVVALWGASALARVGGGESYDSGRSDSGGDDSGLIALVLELLIRLVIQYPAVGIPLLLIAIGVYVYVKRRDGSDSTRKALDEAEAGKRTTVAARDVDRWVGALKARDSAFDLIAFLDRARRSFIDLQEAWFVRNLDPVRRFLSDATFTRLAIQLKLLDAQGIRDAIADVQVLDLQIIGLEQSPFFDTVHLRIKAQLRDDVAAATDTDEEARSLAKRKSLEPFTEVWSFVRKPGASSKDTQGACPNCGAVFAGGASNQCDFCKAIVNSGHYDWVLAEITQGSEYVRSAGEAIDGFAQLQARDPELNAEVLEDRASLCFWKWVDAQSSNESTKLAKLAVPAFTAELRTQLETLAGQHKRMAFIECAVGAVNLLAVSQAEGVDLAYLELRWSARSGLVPQADRRPTLPSRPQRSVFVLQRSATALTPPKYGLSTARCPNCGAPLTDNASVSCEFCGTLLATGERDWVLRDVLTWEAWAAVSVARANPVSAVSPRPLAQVDAEERQRLLYVMASIAAADGTIDAREKKLLKQCADRWSVPFANVELALTAGPALFDRLIARGSVEAEGFLEELVKMALVDGRIDASERQLLAKAALHLGMTAKLKELLLPR